MGKKPLLFGEFLRNKGLISEKDILVARHVQQETNKQIGELAIKQKMLSAQRVQEILQQQEKTSKKFGEIAIDLKILTRDQVKELLSYQKDFNIHMGEIFKFEGALSSDDLGKAIEEFASLEDSAEPKND